MDLNYTNATKMINKPDEYVFSQNNGKIKIESKKSAFVRWIYKALGSDRYDLAKIAQIFAEKLDQTQLLQNLGTHDKTVNAQLLEDATKSQLVGLINSKITKHNTNDPTQPIASVADIFNTRERKSLYQLGDALADARIRHKIESDK